MSATLIRRKCCCEEPCVTSAILTSPACSLVYRCMKVRIDGLTVAAGTYAVSPSENLVVDAPFSLDSTIAVAYLHEVPNGSSWASAVPVSVPARLTSAGPDRPIDNMLVTVRRETTVSWHTYITVRASSSFTTPGVFDGTAAAASGDCRDIGTILQSSPFAPAPSGATMTVNKCYACPSAPVAPHYPSTCAALPDAVCVPNAEFTFRNGFAAQSLPFYDCNILPDDETRNMGLTCGCGWRWKNAAGTAYLCLVWNNGGWQAVFYDKRPTVQSGIGDWYCMHGTGYFETSIPIDTSLGRPTGTFVLNDVESAGDGTLTVTLS